MGTISMTRVATCRSITTCDKNFHCCYFKNVISVTEAYYRQEAYRQIPPADIVVDYLIMRKARGLEKRGKRICFFIGPSFPAVWSVELGRSDGILGAS